MITADALVKGDTLRVVGHGTRWDGLEGRVQRIRPLASNAPDALVTIAIPLQDVADAGIPAAQVLSQDGKTVEAAFVLAHLEPVPEES